MRTIKIKVFTFDELNEEAKENARNWWRNFGLDDVWFEERKASYYDAKKLYDELECIEGEIFGSRLYAWIENNLSHNWTEQCVFSKHKDGSFRSNWWSHKYDCVKSRTSRIKRVNNLEGCPLTGVCYDYNFIKPIIEFMKSPSSSVSNLDLSIPSYESVAEEDFEWMNSDEYIDDAIEANEYEFTEDGNKF